ncbi:MAG: SOS response-associated peptidase [Candidatus Micrarchaeota archaeon]|nr:SOS response-associated peptidase [Candidatus Micrarchaeota archaeon]
MCGRFSLWSSVKILEERFGIKSNLDFKPNYNISPGNNVLSIVSEPVKKFKIMKWSFPLKFPNGEAKELINIRAETIFEKPSFQNLIKTNRCLIVTDGFYEWKKSKGRAEPFYIRLKDGRPFTFAGIWKTIDNAIPSCAIITTEANKKLKNVHDRMPVIVRQDYEDEWIDKKNNDAKKLKQILTQSNSDEIESYKVSDFVNHPENNGPECIKLLSNNEVIKKKGLWNFTNNH